MNTRETPAHSILSPSGQHAAAACEPLARTAHAGPRCSPDAAASIRMLVVIACYGSRNLSLLRQVMANYRTMALDVDIVVVSEAPKDLGPDVEVVVGLPSKNPWSLPFAHKAVFAERADRYDLFLYSEDDMGVTERHVWAFLNVSEDLADDEIAGFLRYEEDADGRRSLPDLHGRYRWRSESIARRGRHTVAEFTNEHAAMYLLTRDQLRRAIDSGGFLRPPYEDRHDMLCTAATDPYTGCGMRKVICISSIDDFLVQHLSNRYAQTWGVSLPTLRAQLQLQIEIGEGARPASSLMETESRMPRGEWSKDYDDDGITGWRPWLGGAARSVLLIGAGRLSHAAADRTDANTAVTVLPLDSIVGADWHELGAEVVYGSLDDSLASLRGRAFDQVIVPHLLHLLPWPLALVSRIAELVAPGGSLIVAGPNFRSARTVAKRLLRRNGYERIRSHRLGGVVPLGPHLLKPELRRCGLTARDLRWLSGSREQGLADARFGILSARSWVLRAVREGATCRPS